MNQNGKKVLALSIVLLFSVWLINFQTSIASKTLAVPSDYVTISEAINHASEGDIIVVQHGVYHENLQVNKSISIIGENPQTTTLIGEGGLDRGARPVVTLNADNAKISGFTIESLPYTTATNTATGIIIHGDHCTIKNNIIQSNYIGIFCSIQSYTQIVNNTIIANLKDGMRVYGVYVNESSPVEFWDNGPQVGGNFWSDYPSKYPYSTEIGASGIANIPY